VQRTTRRWLFFALFPLLRVWPPRRPPAADAQTASRHSSREPSAPWLGRGLSFLSHPLRPLLIGTSWGGSQLARKGRRADPSFLWHPVSPGSLPRRRGRPTSRRSPSPAAASSAACLPLPPTCAAPPKVSPPALLEPDGASQTSPSVRGGGGADTSPNAALRRQTLETGSAKDVAV
jgi:hypothetical protein